MNEKEKKLVEAIANICEELGWAIAVPYTSDGEDQVEGLIIGTNEYLESILSQLDDMEALAFEGEDLDDIILKKDDKETVH